MAKSKIVKGIKGIEKTVVGGYKKIETSVVNGYTKIEDKFVDMYLTRNGETVDQAKERLKKEQIERMAQKENISNTNRY